MSYIADKFNELVKIRDSKQEVFFGDSNDPVIDDEISLLTNNISETISFLKSECTAHGFVVMSEIFDEIVENTQSHEFVDALNEVARKYPDETKRYNIQYFIDTLDGFFRD